MACTQSLYFIVFVVFVHYLQKRSVVAESTIVKLKKEIQKLQVSNNYVYGSYYKWVQDNNYTTTLMVAISYLNV